jgi:ring-1,2-phenylacetyl-CoA epoxidase subunit PaaC
MRSTMLWPYHGRTVRGGRDRARGDRDGLAVDPESLRATLVDARIDQVLGEATLSRPKLGSFQTGGRSGRHTEHLGFLLAELAVPAAHLSGRGKW